MTTELALRLLRTAETHTPAIGSYRAGAHMYLIPRYETQSDDIRATMKLQALIADLHLRVQVLDADIHDEEQRTSMFDVTSVAYPVLARNLRVRRDNLLATIRMLEIHLAETNMAA
jgi:hypothetical protein